MKRTSYRIYRRTWLLVLHFFLLHVVLFANFSIPLAQSVYKFEVEEGKQISESLWFQNTCPKPATFSVKNLSKYLRIEKASELISVNPNSNFSVRFSFDAAGLERNTYSNQIIIKCVHCHFCCIQVGFEPIIKIKVVPATSVFIPPISPVTTPGATTPSTPPAATTTPAPAPLPTPALPPVEKPSPTETLIPESSPKPEIAAAQQPTPRFSSDLNQSVGQNTNQQVQNYKKTVTTKLDNWVEELIAARLKAAGMSKSVENKIKTYFKNPVDKKTKTDLLEKIKKEISAEFQGKINVTVLEIYPQATTEEKTAFEKEYDKAATTEQKENLVNNRLNVGTLAEQAVKNNRNIIEKEVDKEVEKQGKNIVDPTPTPTPTPSPTPSRTETPSPSPTEAPVPTPFASTEQTPTPPEVKTVNLGLIFAAVVTVLIGAIIAKKLFDKWKYGNNFANLGSLKKAVKAKEELSNNWMKKRRSKNIHAIGVGKIDGTENYCIQVFVENADGQMLENPPVQLLPAEYRNFPIYIFEMPRAVFLTGNYGKAKDPHDTIIGGISGANTNLSNEYGTIGYFCSPTILRPIRKFRKEVFLLSNAHVFANLSNPEKTVKDLIQQPSPGENKRHRFIASLEKYVPIKFDNDTEDPNFTDAAIAKLLPNVAYNMEIPEIGKITDHIPTPRVELRQKCRKFGRTTGYTEGKIFSIHLSIWIKHGVKESFFKEQFLIVPEDAHDDFLLGGDSGSLVADHENRAIGLIFAGAGSHTNFGLENLPTEFEVQSLLENRGEKIRNYAVANPISRVLKDLNVKLTL